MAGYSMYGMAGIGIAGAIGFVLILGSIGGNIVTKGPGLAAFESGNSTIPFTLSVAPTQKIAKFSSIDELRTFLTNVEASRNAFSTAQTGMPASFSRFSLGDTAGNTNSIAPTSPDASTGPSSSSGKAAVTSNEINPNTGPFSSTNNQVAGVDEPDFVKNDSKYAYVLSGDKLTIADVYPPENATIVARIGLDIKNGQYMQNMFLNNNTLVVFYTDYAQDYVIPQYDFAPQPVSTPKTHAILLDVSDRENPKNLHDYEVSGAYHDARMIGDRVYVLTVSDLYNYRQPLIPKITESTKTVVEPDIFYFKNPEPYYNFNTVTSISLGARGESVNSKTFMMNPASTLYVSNDNIYIAYQKFLPFNYYEQSSRDRFFTVVVPLLPEDPQDKINAVDSDTSVHTSDKWDRIATILEDSYNSMSESEKSVLFDKIQKSLAIYDSQAQRDATKTVIQKISIGASGEIEYKAQGEVPGTLLNQFSMDQSGNRFRVATMVQYYSPYAQGLYSNIYVLDGDLQTVGKLERIQPGEAMYSTRFTGDKLYLVTFQRVDPFFVIDLSEDTPRILGALKLPGYSTYLHPYDKDHVISVGKDTKDSGNGGVVQTGVKLALFDVSDVANPKLSGNYTILGQGTDSEVLQDHKALLFNREEPNILSIPIIKYDTGEGKHAPDGQYVPPKVWRGFYVFGVSPDEGFTLKGTVVHSDNASDPYYYYGVQGSRSFYIGDVIYTVSAGNLLKMNDIDSLEDLGHLQIGTTGDVIKYPIPLDIQPAK